MGGGEVYLRGILMCGKMKAAWVSHRVASGASGTKMRYELLTEM